LYGILSVLVKAVPVILIIWCCIKNSNNVNLNESIRGFKNKDKK